MELLCPHSALNQSQRAAVQLCSDSDPAFVWGPPGTGKTTTLARIVPELLAQKMRVLLLATTNAALDQALEKVAHDPEGKEWIDAGRVVRIGRTEGLTFGAAITDVLTRLNIVHQKKLSRTLKRRAAAEAALSTSFNWILEPGLYWLLRFQKMLCEKIMRFRRPTFQCV